MRSWFADFPGKQPEFAEFLSQGRARGRPATEARPPQCFAFSRANLLRKYGPDWHGRHVQARPAAPAQLGPQHHRQLVRGEHVPDAAHALHRFHRQRPRAKRIEGSEGYWGKFPDVFDPSFADALRQSMEASGARAPATPGASAISRTTKCPGARRTSPGGRRAQIAAGPAGQEGLRRGPASQIRRIAKLNAAWGTAHASWDALLESRERAGCAEGGADLAAFDTEARRAVFPHGARRHQGRCPEPALPGLPFRLGQPPAAAAAAAKYCDVVSYNIYHRSVADFQFRGGADVPLIIGEFHFGALDRGLFHPAWCPSPTRSPGPRHTRAMCSARCTTRSSSAATGSSTRTSRRPAAATGRTYQIGFIDVCDTPYPEIVAACREVAAALYR